MAGWKKIIVSGSKAHLNELTASNILVTGSGTITAENFQIDPVTGNPIPISSGGTGLGSIASGQFFVGSGSDGELTTANTSSILAKDLSYDNAYAESFITASTAPGVRNSLALNSMATQSDFNVDINGGVIDGTDIGGSTPASGSFTILTNAYSGDLATGSASSLSGSFTGSFIGDGHLLTGIVTSLSMSANQDSAGTTGGDSVDLKTQVLQFAGQNDITSSIGNNIITHSLHPDLKTVTSLTNTSLTKIGTAFDQEYIKFDTSDEVNVHINDGEVLSVDALGINLTGGITSSKGADIGGNLVVTHPITGSRGAHIKGSLGTFAASDGTTRNVGLHVDQDVSASGFTGEFFEITSSILITSESTQFGNTDTDTHLFAGDIVIQTGSVGFSTETHAGRSGSREQVIDLRSAYSGVSGSFWGEGTFYTASIASASITSGRISDVEIVLGTGKTLDLTNATLTLDAGEIAADKISAGTFTAGAYDFAGSTIADLGIVTTADINGGSIDGTTAGGLDIGRNISSSGDQDFTQGAFVIISGSMTGSFFGDGAGLKNVGTDLSVVADTGTDSVGVNDESFTLKGHNGIATVLHGGAPNTLQISASSAQASSTANIANRGVASFASAQFSVADGHVTMSKIANDILVNDGITLTDSNTSPNSSDRNLGETLTFSHVAGETTVSHSIGTVTIGLPDHISVNSGSFANGVQVGGGYGSTGTTLHDNGDIDMDGNLTVGGGLTVLGTTTNLQSQDLVIEDNLLYLSSGSQLNPESVDSGLVFERSQGSPHKFSTFFWDETANRFALGVLDTPTLMTDDGLAGATSLINAPSYVMSVSASVHPPTSSQTAYETAGQFGMFGDNTVADSKKGQVVIDDEENIWIWS